MLVLSFAVASSFGMFAPFFAVGQLGLFAIQVCPTAAPPRSFVPCILLSPLPLHLAHKLTCLRTHPPVGHPPLIYRPTHPCTCPPTHAPAHLPSTPPEQIRSHCIQPQSADVRQALVEQVHQVPAALQSIPPPLWLTVASYGSLLPVLTLCCANCLGQHKTMVSTQCMTSLVLQYATCVCLAAVASVLLVQMQHKRPSTSLQRRPFLPTNDVQSALCLLRPAHPFLACLSVSTCGVTFARLWLCSRAHACTVTHWLVFGKHPESHGMSFAKQWTSCLMAIQYMAVQARWHPWPSKPEAWLCSDQPPTSPSA